MPLRFVDFGGGLSPHSFFVLKNSRQAVRLHWFLLRAFSEQDTPVLGLFKPIPRSPVRFFVFAVVPSRR